MARTKRSTPAELTPGWPAEPSPDPAAEVARKFALALEAGRGERSLRLIARDAGISHTILLKVLAGATWPDLATLARIERSVGVRLWPDLD